MTGVLLLDLVAPGQAPVSLFDMIDAPGKGLMNAMDQISARYGQGTARLSLAQKDGEWHIRRENLSPSFTTRWGISLQRRWGEARHGFPNFILNYNMLADIKSISWRSGRAAGI